jgi:hypothetical protein
MLLFLCGEKVEIVREKLGLLRGVILPPFSNYKFIGKTVVLP